MSDQLPIHWRLLRGHILDALHRQKDYETAEVLAQHLDKGDWRGVAEFKLDDDDRLDLNSLTYRIDIRDDTGEWVPLCYVHWSRLGLEWADVLYEARLDQAPARRGNLPRRPARPELTLPISVIIPIISTV